MMKTKLTLFVTVLAAALFMGGCASTEPAFVGDGLVAYYPFNGNAKDESGNGNDGEVRGATLSGDRSGDQDAAYAFNGTDEYIDLGDKPAFDFGTGDFTISLWFQASGNQFNKYIIGKYHGTKPPAFGIGTHNIPDTGETKGYAFIFDGGESISVETRGAANMGDGNWHHRLVAFDRDEKMAMFLDGALEVSSAISGETESISNEYNLNVGRINSGQHFGGKIDDIRIYDRALSAEEVKALYDLEKPKSK